MRSLSRDEMQDLIQIERPVASTSYKGAGAGTWLPVDEVWAAVKDLPSKGEHLEQGLTTNVRRARVRIWHRPDITAAMRFVMGDRIMQIVAGPNRLGRDALEFIVEDCSTAGNAA